MLVHYDPEFSSHLMLQCSDSTQSKSRHTEGGDKSSFKQKLLRVVKMFKEEEIDLQLRTKKRLLQNSKDARCAVCFTVTAICILKEYHGWKKTQFRTVFTETRIKGHAGRER